MKVKTYEDAGRMATHITLEVDQGDMRYFAEATLNKAVHLAAEALAARICEELGPEIISKLDPQAIANMTIAEAGAAVNRTLKEKLPDKIVEVVRTVQQPVYYQRGIFGGLRRL